MVDTYNIYQFCNKCRGAGIVRELIGQGPEGPIYEDKTCDDCNGVKKHIWGEMREEEIET